MDALLNPYYLQILMFILINAMLGISIYLTLATGQLSLGNAGFMSVGAYTSALLTLKLGIPVYLAIPTGGLAACLMAAVIGIPATRLQGIYLAIATLGFGEVVRVIILNLKITNGALGLSGIPSLGVLIGKQFSAMGYSQGLAGFSLQQISNLSVIAILAAILAFIVFFAVRLRNSRIGRAFASIKADEHAAEVSGVNTTRYKLLAFFLGAFVAGIAGGLAAHITFYIGPKDFSYHRAVEILLFAVFGGSNVVWGPLLGSVILTTLPELLRSAADYRAMIYGGILVIMMIFRPQGLISEETIRYWQSKLKTSSTAGEQPEPTRRSAG
ncbi:branched-chain amino acid ABC transporter permease [Sporomusa sp.]|jgi:branched-chain amino acid transport system permease protein|uniref:branched-chain amino acid ABC transporter permease n=1 Tax=Sporomusa sp. TaxID=2078658 RepID=UPI002BFD5C76|nr:branched-chain amino acid ABC transporter permease [Sporomusa sp.]MDF2875501.1 urea transporter, permease protein UrtC [Sporomusa sp.]HWR07562.1 branched-chain amino acid ABC transporter permease [Sporomusa sp.]